MLASALWILPAILATIDASVQHRLRGGEAASWRQILFAGGDWLIYGLLTPAIFWASARWPVRRPRMLPHATLHLGGALLFCLAWALAGKLLEAALGFALEPEATLDAFAAENLPHRWIDLASWVSTTMPFGVIVYLGIAGLAHAFAFFVESRDREVEVARLAEQLAGARFAALQAQVNPHFLFNTLNTIVVRARDGDRDGTVRMVEQLSEMLRRTLGRHRADEVPLAEELDLVRRYLEIEQARFPDRLRASFEIAPGLEHGAVPGFALQHLVENAVRHGVALRTEASVVEIAARRDGDELVLSVRDQGPGLPDRFVAPPGRGLEQTRERLRLLHGERASLGVERSPGGGVVATLRLPYRRLREPEPEGST